jgi:hypothetical protein
MFIRQTKTNTSSSGEAYLTYRLVESRREGKKVFQRTLLNLGRNFTLPREDWSELCVRIDQILTGQKPLFPAGPAIEEQAQHFYSQLIALRSEALPAGAAAVEDFQEVDVNSLQLAKSRSGA